MFNPEMMKMASEMMAKMTPEQMAQMQQMAGSMSPEMMQQAMAQMQNTTPEQLNQMRTGMSGMSGDAFTSQAATQMGQESSQPKHQLNAAAQLKAEGNRLHGAKRFGEAAEKYERALANLQGHTSQQSRELRTSCQSNLASCFLQLERWRDCVDACDTVLAEDSNNRKALYRRGQALCAMGQYDGAVSDLLKAVQLSPDSEKDIIREKLREAQQKQRQAQQGFTIEEITEPAAADEQPAGPAATPPPVPGQQEGLAESDTDDDMPPLENPQPASGPAAMTAASTTAGGTSAGAGLGMPPFVPPGMDAARMQQTADMLKANPDVARQAAAAMSAMSDEQIVAMAAQRGMPGMTPEMVKQAAAMMRSMPPEQLSFMAAASAGGFPAPPPAVSTGTAAPPFAAPGIAGAAGGVGGNQMAAAAEAMRQNPGMMKQAAAMMESMPEEELQRMAAMMPGTAGAQVDPAQMKMAAKMMANMSPEDMERMTRMAANMGVHSSGSAGGGARAPATASIGAGSQADMAACYVATEAVPAAGGAAVPPLAGMPAGFDPANMPADMMADMRKRMQDPEMLKMMKSMMKGMDSGQLAEMMKASGLNVTPEQARGMVDKLDSVSDKHLEWIARIMSYVNAVVAAYRRAKEWVFSQGALVLAVVMLLIALLLKWLGWM